MKPFLKWAGGKRFLSRRILQLLPKKINTYYEPFLGGGAIFFALAAEDTIRFKDVVLADANAELMNAYQTVRDSLYALFSVLGEIEQTYIEKDADARKDFFLKIRARDRDPEYFAKYDSIERAARMIFLNRTAFNGLYRVNKSDQFNAPHGKYKNPTILDYDNLTDVHHALQNVTLQLTDFEDCLDHAESGDVVYLDPPYFPVKAGSFTTYTSDGFSYEDHVRLATLMRTLKEKHVIALESNSYTEEVLTLHEGLTIHEVEVPRRINSDGDGRGSVAEALIINT